jgi:hypothetical protein
MLEDAQPCSLRACSRDDPECGARRGVSLLPLVPAKAGTQHLDSRRSAFTRVFDALCAGMSGRGKPRWSAERRASRVMGRKAPRKRLACRDTARPTGASQAPERLSALRPPSPGARSNDAKPRAQKMRRGNESGCLKSETGMTNRAVGIVYPGCGAARASAKRCAADPGPPRTGTVHASRVYPTCAHLSADLG